MSEEINKLREDRVKTHGSFRAGAKFVQTVMVAAAEAPSWNNLTDVEKECIHHVVQKLQRVVCGSQHRDHWVDIAGYAMIAADDMETE